MKWYSLVPLLSLLLSLSFGQRRIIDGKVGNPFQYKFLVALVTESGLNCGGSLLDRTTILTAAHCTLPNIQQFALIHRFNLTKTDEVELGIRIPVKSTINHPQFDSSGQLENDVAIYRLVEPIPDNIAVSFVQLNQAIHNESEGTPLYIAGWGIYQLNSTNNSPILRTSQLKVFQFNQCNTQYEGKLTLGSQICMVPSDHRKESCSGDSGSPIFMEMGKRFVQVGITSYGEQSCDAKKNIPSIYSSIYFHSTWIHKVWKGKCVRTS